LKARLFSGRAESFEGAYAWGEGSRCRSNESGTKDFEAAVNAMAALPQPERVALIGARKALSPTCTNAGALGITGNLDSPAEPSTPPWPDSWDPKIWDEWSKHLLGSRPTPSVPHISTALSAVAVQGTPGMNLGWGQAHNFNFGFYNLGGYAPPGTPTSPVGATLSVSEEVQSARGKAFLTYIEGAKAFYGGDFATASARFAAPMRRTCPG
jgi:hypothetical protein